MCDTCDTFDTVLFVVVTCDIVLLVVVTIPSLSLFYLIKDQSCRCPLAKLHVSYSTVNK